MNIQMKQRYILPALLLLCAACQQEEWAQPEADSSDAIRFAAPTITVEELTRSTFHDAFPTGGTFGVLGYCVPYQRGSDTEMDWASGSANWGNKSGNAFPDVFFNQAVTYNGSACTYDYNNSGGPRKWYNTTQNQEAISPDNYRYTFFAYYPMDDFTVESPTNATTRGVPKLTFTMPFAETGTYSGTYPGTYVIYNNEEGFAIAPNSSVPLIGDKHLLLLSNATDGTYFGENVKVHVEYTYRGEAKNASAERPTQFQPRAGVRYTAQLNFVGETFALNFIAAEDEFWEDGGDSDVSIQ